DADTIDRPTEPAPRQPRRGALLRDTGPLRGRVRREVGARMRAYELMVIVDGDQDDQALGQLFNQIEAQVAEIGGEVRKTDHWGRRRFAYEINHKWEGYYGVIELV